MSPGQECLREGGERPQGATRPAPRGAAEPSRGGILACIRCEHAITSAGDRIAVGESHEHTFANPHGIRYRIGCFARAGGCSPLGPSSTYWTWFPGFAWQIELCASCGEHLGWLFRSADSVFHGLILDRLVEVSDQS